MGLSYARSGDLRPRSAKTGENKVSVNYKEGKDFKAYMLWLETFVINKIA